MEITGQILKERRESLKLSLSEISMSTKINQKILRAIEEGDQAHLPAKTFLRGFVQAYAIALKLDVDTVMKSFYEEMGTTTPEVNEAEDASAQVISGRTLPATMETSTTAKVLAVSGIIVLIFLVLGVKNLVEKYEQESRVEPVPATLESLVPHAGETSEDTSTADTAATAEKTPESDKAPVTSEASSAVTTAPATEAKNEDTSAAVPIPLAESKPSPAEPPPPEPKTEPEPATPVVKTPPASEANETRAAASSPPKEVILEALDRIEVAVKVDSGAIRKVVLQPDEVYTIKGTGKIILDLSDGGAVNLIVNGRDRGVPGDLGKPKRVELP